MKDPPPLADPEVSKTPEPVSLNTSPAAIGVPGILFSALAVSGPIRLNENDVVVACALPSVVANARIVRTELIARTVAFMLEFFIL